MLVTEKQIKRRNSKFKKAELFSLQIGPVRDDNFHSQNTQVHLAFWLFMVPLQDTY